MLLGGQSAQQSHQLGGAGQPLRVWVPVLRPGWWVAAQREEVPHTPVQKLDDLADKTIIVTTGTVLYPQGIEISSAADAASALAPTQVRCASGVTSVVARMRSISSREVLRVEPEAP